jgi:hypothetical protein
MNEITNPIVGFKKNYTFTREKGIITFKVIWVGGGGGVNFIFYFLPSSFSFSSQFLSIFI